VNVGDLPAKFGWRARWVRASKLFGLALLSVFVVELEALVLMSLGGGPEGEEGLEAAFIGLVSPLKEPFWLAYAVFGLPIAIAHALGSLAWRPKTNALAVHAVLTVVSVAVMLTAIVANPFFSYVFAIVVLILGHTTCFMGPPPKAEAASQA
jgi:hypothetical protein